jgi:tetratricopeptide (TPR) repeat protein
VIAATPGDCYDCVRTRGQIASEAKQWGRADYWFAKAVHDAPSIPFAHEDWGRSLLARGKPDDAIAQFTIANQKGPHFADPLEGWGEALMAKNQSHLALAKFAESEKYAPNWGRLHLKWGEALIYAGKRDEAKAHFLRAATLDLTLDEKAELAKVPHG